MTVDFSGDVSLAEKEGAGIAYGGVRLRDQNQGVSMDAGSERGRSCQGTAIWLHVGFKCIAWASHRRRRVAAVLARGYRDAMAEDDRGQELEVKLVHDSFREQRLG
ncbi:hypothetical protein BHM03_00033867 [Ensete ventricosum]|nr:hypothetical protein BHM03_00033867 [Ensete ventricosum]